MQRAGKGSVVDAGQAAFQAANSARDSRVKGSSATSDEKGC